MNDFNRAYSPGPSGQTMDMSVNEGLRSFMLGVYNKMALGLLLTGIEERAPRLLLVLPALLVAGLMLAAA